MELLKQVKIEIKNVLRSKFLLIIGALIILSSIAVPIINAISENNNPNNNMMSPMPMYGGMDIAYEQIAYQDSYYGGEGDSDESVTVDGITVSGNNPFYWNIVSIQDEKEYFTRDERFSDPAVLDLLLELMDIETAHYLKLAQLISTNQDYRRDLARRGIGYIHDKFIYEHNDADADMLMEALQYRMGFDQTIFKQKYIEITSEERLKALDEIDEKLNVLYETIEKNDFPTYVALSIKQENDNIDELNEQIAMHEQNIIDNPEQEEYLSQTITELEKQINNIKTNVIPIWEYRLKNNIVPRDGSWQNSALSQIESYRNQLMYIQIMTEEEFNEERYMAEEYGTYAQYKEKQQKQIDEANEYIFIAQSSLDAGQPDMSFVPDGARTKTIGFLGYSIFVALFSILAGGWIIAREFSQGTIRLLMIRPKTRTKILMSKFLAVLAICLAMYIAGCLLNIVVNGIFAGFTDYGYLNFTASGEIGFFAYYLPKFLACIVSIIFGYTVAFMLSSVTKNIAVSIAVPIVCFIGCIIALSVLAYTRIIDWIAYTPVPYVQVSSFYTQWSPVNTLISRGVPIDLTYGIILLLGLSAICTFISIWVFKKRDITN